MIDAANVQERRFLPFGNAHGGVAQGIGQAAMERVVHDPDSGQVLTGSLMDYQLPRAGDATRGLTTIYARSASRFPTMMKIEEKSVTPMMTG